MIEEEEDDEKILEKGFSFKGALKAFFVILLIMLGAYFMYLGFNGEWGNFFLGILFLCLGTTLMQMQKQTPEPLRQTLSILICGICGLTKVRNYETGDFVFNKTSDKCNKCKSNDLMEIKQIYSVKLKKPVAETKKGEAKKDKK